MIPNFGFSKSSIVIDNCDIIPSIVFVAITDIEQNEEVLLNYHYDITQKSKLPSWYSVK